MGQKSIVDKKMELYQVLVDKLYHYFVEEKKEARIDTVVSLLSALTHQNKDKDAISEAQENFEEVDLI